MDETIDHDQKLSRVCSESTTEQVNASSTFTVTWWSLDKGAVDKVDPIGRKFILTYSDYYSSYPEAHLLQEIT